MGCNGGLMTTHTITSKTKESSQKMNILTRDLQNDASKKEQPQVQYHVLLTPVTCRVLVSKAAHVAECDR
ncbi:unnamed protein product [Acanthoscelides obtectus]|uniref:Uncharacterized protein n=1 Tax=Acanthoscelides obtectus TaxID=200917 RepID=A0A9P0JND6_ACAOB|nr:unnamed protein product [Acanthoscelides obtectus]CAK1673829.1 hypothetical protein AOBTE_LOCUS29451 [Acanthoscelides obtectus]